MSRKGKKGKIGKNNFKKLETHSNKSKSSLHDNNFGRSQIRWGGNMSKKGKKGKIGGKNSKKLETHSNKSKIGNGRQVCMTTILEDLKQGGVVI